MFSDGTGKPGVFHNETDDLWAVHISTPQFWAWRDWMHDALGYGMQWVSHTNWLSVWSEWPPATAAAAVGIAKRISDMRDELRIAKPVPRRPEPWDGVVPTVPEEYRNTPIR